MVRDCIANPAGSSISGAHYCLRQLLGTGRAPLRSWFPMETKRFHQNWVGQLQTKWVPFLSFTMFNSGFELRTRTHTENTSVRLVRAERIRTR
jgi:hypothetical protein